MSFSSSVPEEQPPKLFVSYSHDSQDHKNWVVKLATRLRHNGIDVQLDTWNTPLGSNLTLFMEKAAANSPRVLAIISESYAQKANDLEGGVGFEKNILSSRIMEDASTPIVIPLLRNNQSKAIPVFLLNRKYIDFRDDSEFEAKYTELIYELYGKSVEPIPPLGSNPFGSSITPPFISLQRTPSRFSSKGTVGTVKFDYTSNDGRIKLGEGIYEIETKWSNAGNRAIYAYSDSPGIQAIALAEVTKTPEELGDISKYDFTSRVRRAEPDDCIIWLNNHGKFGVTRIDHVFVSHSKPREYELELTYWLNIDPNESPK